MLLFAVVWGSGACLSVNAATKRPFVLVIDAGHGGKDAGAVGQLTKEKDINLNVALALGRLVEQNCPDVKVIYTRKTDIFVTLQGRADIANRNKADLFISVHTNSSPVGKAAPMGAETYTLGMHRAADNLEVAKRENSVITQENNYKQTYHNFDPRKSESYIIFEFMQDRNMQQSVDLARAIQRNYTSSGRHNKGVHQAGFLVLRATSMPSVLTELGFISNAEEEKFLHSRQGVETLARAIFEGFKAYRQKHHAENVLSPENTNDEGEAQPLVAENAPTTEPLSPRDAVRNSVTVPQPVDVSTLKAEVVPVPTRPFGQPATPVEKTHEETAKVISLPELPPAVATSTPAKAGATAHQDSLVPVLPVEVTTPQLDTTTPLVAEQTSQPIDIMVPPPTQKLAKTASTAAKTVEALSVAANQDHKTMTQEVKVVEQTVKTQKQEVKTAKQEVKVVQQDTKRTQPEIKTQKQETKTEKQESKTVTKETKEKQKKEAQTAPKVPENSNNQRVVFKLQLFTIDRALRSDDRHFKGLSPVEYYEEGGRYKYTYGATTNYDEAKRLQKEIADCFPDAFVVAFLNNQRTELAEAIKLSKLTPNGKN
jgi:N-acetylmuramoyl-L-alanine amidase, family 3